MPEIVGTFLRTELWDEGADGAVKAWDGSRCHFTQECLEFAVRHLDGIEVGRIFRQVTQCRAHCFDSPANAGPQMDPAVIHHDDSSVAQPLKIMKTRACVIEILSCILETRAPS